MYDAVIVHDVEPLEGGSGKHVQGFRAIARGGEPHDLAQNRFYSDSHIFLTD